MKKVHQATYSTFYQLYKVCTSVLKPKGKPFPQQKVTVKWFDQGFNFKKKFR